MILRGLLMFICFFIALSILPIQQDGQAKHKSVKIYALPTPKPIKR